MNPTELAGTIDHTLLKPEAVSSQIDSLCDETWALGFAGVCVHPIWVPRVTQNIDKHARNDPHRNRPAIVSVTGFPLGCCDTANKVDQAARAIDNGASEIDMVIHLGALIEGDTKAVRKDIESVSRVVHQRLDGGILKVILETRALNDEQIIAGCRCTAEGEADFVKTSTGYHPAGGACVEHVHLLHRHASPIRVKASGGIRTACAAIELVEAGASRIGTSSGVAIMKELELKIS